MTTQIETLPKASLYFTSGSSDKEYHAEVIEQDGGHVVIFRYGRRGSSLTAGTKTATPVELDKAIKVFEKLVQDKLSKGYSPGESGTVFQATPMEKHVSGLLPQLLNPIDDAQLHVLLNDDNWMMQPKMDGKRIMVRIQSGNVTANNRKGLVVAIPLIVAEELSMLGDCVLDGEMVGQIYHVFDCIERSGREVNLGAMQRYSVAETILRDGMRNVRLVWSHTNKAVKHAKFEEVKSAKGEGVVFKRAASLYTVGRPNSGGNQLKYKFTESASCIVSGINPGKRSVSIKLRSVALECAGSKDPFEEVGNVTIPPNYSIPQVGDVVEVEYLYAYLLGSLYQPVFRGKRDDIDPAACTLLQLKFKPEAAEEDEL